MPTGTLKGNQNDIAQREHDLGNEAQRVIGVDPFGGITTDGNFVVMIDQTDSNNIYLGKAQIGSATSALVWQLRRIKIDGNVTTFAWAGGTDEFVKEWDERASYVYS